MKIAFILNASTILSGDSNGIKAQARSWKDGLLENGHTVIEVSPWGNYNWAVFDAIHIFGTGLWIHNFINSLRKKNPHIYLSPIIDSDQPTWLYKLNSRIGSKKLRLWSPTYTLLKSVPYLKGIFVRSKHESGYLPTSIPKNKIHIVPLTIPKSDFTTTIEKKDFCLHISSIWQPRKNVLRLIEAAKKYDFKLILAGSKGTETQYEKIKTAIGDNKKIKVLGFVSNEEKQLLYKEAKVFALPSLNEGVGIVALEAAVHKCEIVITSIGGPKEYFKPYAEIIDPHDIDKIGTSIKKLLHDEVSYQPSLFQHITTTCSQKAVAKKIIAAYQKHRTK